MLIKPEPRIQVATLDLVAGEMSHRSDTDHIFGLSPPFPTIVPASWTGGQRNETQWGADTVGYISPTIEVDVVILAPVTATYVNIPDIIFRKSAFETVDMSRVEPRWETSIDDPVMASLIRTMGVAQRTASAADLPLLTEAISAALAVRMAQKLGAATVGDTPYPNGLPARTLRAVLDYIETNLAKHITLAELAGVANLSQFHFARSFKKSMNIAPVRYVWRRRVDCASKSLRRKLDPLVMIALDCGFSSQSHFTTAFKEVMGVTPAAFRAGFMMWLAMEMLDWLLVEDSLGWLVA